MMLSIVPIAERHIKGFQEALDRVAREKMYLAFLKAPLFRETRKFVLENIKNGNPQFVAVADGNVVGWCDVIRSPRDTSKHCGVFGIALVPEFRGKGIGRRLIKAVIKSAWGRQFTRIELTVRKDNANAIRLYKRMGFESEGVRRNAFRIDGKYENLISMALLKKTLPKNAFKDGRAKKRRAAQRERWALG
jgi:RimJ/RimL family protein N-acetyltransferase